MFKIRAVCIQEQQMRNHPFKQASLDFLTESCDFHRSRRDFYVEVYIDSSIAFDLSPIENQWELAQYPLNTLKSPS